MVRIWPFLRKPEPLPHVVVQPRCTCGRFCSAHDPEAEKTDALVRELTEQGSYVPPFFASRSSMKTEG